MDDDSVTMSRKRFTGLWFGLFWLGFLCGWFTGTLTTLVFQ